MRHTLRSTNRIVSHLPPRPALLAVGLPGIGGDPAIRDSAASALTVVLRLGELAIDRLNAGIAFSWQQWLEAAIALAGQARRIAGVA